MGTSIPIDSNVSHVPVTPQKPKSVGRPIMAASNATEKSALNASTLLNAMTQVQNITIDGQEALFIPISAANAGRRVR